VPESEAESYRHTGLGIETIPDGIAGISAVRNWVLRRFTEDAIVMLDDDISACVCMVSLRCRRLRPAVGTGGVPGCSFWGSGLGLVMALRIPCATEICRLC
jgi:hypothetical protein